MRLRCHLTESISFFDYWIVSSFNFKHEGLRCYSYHYFPMIGYGVEAYHMSVLDAKMFESCLQGRVSAAKSVITERIEAKVYS